MITAIFSGVGRIIVETEVCEILFSFRQGKQENEKAGVLAGYRDSDGGWRINRVMPPSDKSRASRYWVYRDKASAQKFINDEFNGSAGTVNYLGEWHTHPCVDPSPSGDDKKMLSDLLKSSVMEIDFLVGIIVGETGVACCWAQQYVKGKVIVLPQQDYDLSNFQQRPLPV